MRESCNNYPSARVLSPSRAKSSHQNNVRTGRTRKLAIATLFVGLLFITPLTWAQPYTYAVDINSGLYRVDLTTAGTTFIGPTGIGGLVEGLAISPSGNLFATDSGGNLYSVNTLSGMATPIGSTGRGNIEGLDFNGTTLVGVDFNTTPTVFSINTATAATANIITAASLTGSVRSMAVLDVNNVLIRGDSPAYNTLYQLNLGTGTVTTIGTLSGNTFAALDFASDGNLYSLDTDGSLYRVNPNTAALTFIGNAGGNFWLDMAAPVPEPGTGSLLGIAILMALKFAKSRK